MTTLSPSEDMESLTNFAEIWERRPPYPGLANVIFPSPHLNVGGGKNKSGLVRQCEDAEQTKPVRPGLDYLLTYSATYSVWPELRKYGIPNYFLAEYRLGERRSEDSHAQWQSNAPIVHLRPFVDLAILPPDVVGNGIRGWCVPGYGDDKTARVRNNDPERPLVRDHENEHFNRISGGDGSEAHVHAIAYERAEHMQSAFQYAARNTHAYPS